MLKTFTSFMRQINYVQSGIDLWTSVAKNTTHDDQKEYCKSRIMEAQETIDGLCKTYPMFATLYRLNLTRRAS